MFYASALLVVTGAIGIYIYQGLQTNKDAGKPVSNAKESVITDNKQLFASPFFQFQDNGDWVLEKTVSSDNDLVYTKYRGVVHEAQLRIYINKSPAPLNIQTSRVLPVHLLNNTHFQVTGVSEPCVTKFPAGQRHHITELTINGAAMLCDPDATTYKVIISEIDGDYTLTMVRPNGEPVQFVITYEDLGLNPKPDSILNIAESFQTR